MAGPFYFAWVAAGTAFNSAVHNREDESIFAFTLDHAEGDFATLTIDVPNPKVGLLAAGRDLWCWFSWFDGAAIVPLFTGRLIGVPKSIDGEVIRLDFVARPADYIAQKAAVAETLKVRPHWDPVWIDEAEDDPDTPLQARTELYHIDRTTLAVTTSDIVAGEDGTVTVADHLYDSLSVEYSGSPKLKASAEATVTWTQKGKGSIDFTRRMVSAFEAAGSTYGYPLISSLTGAGLFDDWPVPGADIGSGWSIGADARIESADWVQPLTKKVTWLRETYTASDTSDTATDDTTKALPGSWVHRNPAGAFKTATATSRGYGGGWTWQPDNSNADAQVTDNDYQTWTVALPLGVYKIAFWVDWEASRERSETLTMTMTADLQSLLVDPGDSAEVKISLSSDRVTEAVDAAATGTVMPIGDKRRNSYFPTDRGAWSIEYILMLMRAELVRAARCVDVSVTYPFAAAVADGLSCRKNATIPDSRLPGGSATGKIKSYGLAGDGGSGSFEGKLTIACTIGHGGSVAAVAGTNTCVDDCLDDVTQTSGTTIDPGTGDVTYQSLDDLDVLDDDGIDLFNMRAADVLNSLTVADGPTDQLAALAIFKPYGATVTLTGGTHYGSGSPASAREPSYLIDGDTPQSVLDDHPTEVTIDLVPISNRSFHTDYDVALSQLKIPKTIDLEAA